MTINLAPADLPKEGGRYDLAIAIAILASSGQVPTKILHQYEFLGELALSGHIRHVNGAIPAALAALTQKRQLVLSSENQYELNLLPDNSVKFAGTLLELCHFLYEKMTLSGNFHPTEIPEPPFATGILAILLDKSREKER